MNKYNFSNSPDKIHVDDSTLTSPEGWDFDDLHSVAEDVLRDPHLGNVEGDEWIALRINSPDGDEIAFLHIEFNIGNGKELVDKTTENNLYKLNSNLGGEIVCRHITSISETTGILHG